MPKVEGQNAKSKFSASYFCLPSPQVSKVEIMTRIAIWALFHFYPAIFFNSL